MPTLELLREVTAVGLTDMFLDRLVEQVESVMRRAELRRDGELNPGGLFPERLAV